MSNKYQNTCFLKRHCLIVSHVEWHAYNNKQRQNTLISHMARLNLIISTLVLCWELTLKRLHYHVLLNDWNNGNTLNCVILPTWNNHILRPKNILPCIDGYIYSIYLQHQKLSNFNKCCFVRKEILIPRVYMCMYICIQFMYLYGGIHAHIVCRLSLVQKEICFLF